MRIARHLMAAALLSVTACSDNPVAPELSASSRNRDLQGRTLGVLSRNLYVGADLDATIGALASPDPSDDLPALQAAIATLLATDYAARAGALAEEIGATQPHVVGLQEVWDIHVNLAPLGLPVVIDLDFLAILQSELARRGLRYEVAGKVRNTEAAPLPGIALTDWDVILVDRARVKVESVYAQQFQFNIGPVAPGVDVRRGYVVMQAKIEGRHFTIGNTHLESGAGAQLSQLRAAQAMELAAVLGDSSRAVLMGDLNDGPGSPMYQVLAAAGWSDTWLLFGSGPGLTCCHAPDLSNPFATFDQRIDYVLQRGFDGAGRVTILGEEPGDRLSGAAGPIWPSDHAGVFAQLRY